MSNERAIIKIRRGSGIPTTSNLVANELGFSTTTQDLYINNGTGITRIGINALTGSVAPVAADGQNGDFYIQTATEGGVTEIVAIFSKVSGAWLQIQTGGGGGSPAVILTDTLVAGQTTLVFSDARITANSRVFPWCSIWGVVPTSVVTVAGSITIVFPVQSVDMTVQIELPDTSYNYAEGESF